MDSSALVDAAFWAGRRVLVTGHTGFKGAWLALWLRELGAVVSGYALAPDVGDSLFERADLGSKIASTLGDVRDADAVEAAVRTHAPEVVFHLAAQALVLPSYQTPVETFATNVMGTVHVLEAARTQPSVRAVVVVTTDKVYENCGSEWPFRETDPLGGHDPYSASKAAAEIVTASYRRSFYGTEAAGAAVASARAGNVIGGGDWAEHRLVPDAIRAFQRGEALRLRNPGHTRPWQHVIDPLVGYVLLAEHLIRTGAGADVAWNFGPNEDGVTTAELAELLAEAWGPEARVTHESLAGAPHEAATLRLDASRAKRRTGWRPRIPLVDAVNLTVGWYRAVLGGEDAYRVCVTQLRAVGALS